MLRGDSYLVFLSDVFFGSLFITLWLTEPEDPGTTDNRPDAERLAAYPISDSSDLAKSAQNANLNLSRRLLGYVDAIRRNDEREVALSGWAADRQGDSTPLEVLIFVAGRLVATPHTKGEPPHVTAPLHLRFAPQSTAV